MKFIGPFLKINSLSRENILHQLFYLSKESLYNLVFESKCGITITPHELSKGIDKGDFNNIKTLSPLICMYRKCSAKLTIESDKLQWNNEKAKKDILISTNGFMTLALMELCKFYEAMGIEDKDKDSLANIYAALAKLQLDFYASSLRNTQGFFIDKKHTSDMFTTKSDFQEKNPSYKISDQALMMCAYYKLSTLEKQKIGTEDKEKKDNKDETENNKENQYKEFSMDILDMLTEYRESVYSLTFSEKLKTCFYLCIFYEYSKDETCEMLLFDLYDLVCEEYKNTSIIAKCDYILNRSLLCIISLLMDHYFNFAKAKDFSHSLVNELVALYDENLCIFNKTSSGKTMEYSCDEILTYMYALYFYAHMNNEEDIDTILEGIFKKSVINSGLVPSWPQTPNLNSPERYKNFSKKSEDLLEDDFFRLSNIATPAEKEVASVFLKHLYINTKKFEFKVSNFNFDSSKNMYIFFMNIFLYNHFSNNK